MKKRYLRSHNNSISLSCYFIAIFVIVYGTEKDLNFVNLLMTFRMFLDKLNHSWYSFICIGLVSFVQHFGTETKANGIFFDRSGSNKSGFECVHLLLSRINLRIVR